MTNTESDSLSIGPKRVIPLNYLISYILIIVVAIFLVIYFLTTSGTHYETFSHETLFPDMRVLVFGFTLSFVLIGISCILMSNTSQSGISMAFLLVFFILTLGFIASLTRRAIHFGTDNRNDGYGGFYLICALLVMGLFVAKVWQSKENRYSVMPVFFVILFFMSLYYMWTASP